MRLGQWIWLKKNFYQSCFMLKVRTTEKFTGRFTTFLSSFSLLHHQNAAPTSDQPYWKCIPWVTEVTRQGSIHESVKIQGFIEWNRERTWRASCAAFPHKAWNVDTRRNTLLQSAVSHKYKLFSNREKRSYSMIKFKSMILTFLDL